VKPFTYTAQAARVVFGPGTISTLPAEIDRLSSKRVLVLCTPDQEAQAQMVVDALGERVVGIFAKAVMHVPVEIAKQAQQDAVSKGADCVVAIGGGSTTGLGKAIALETSLPVVAIPTTYAGSEMTPIYGLTENGLKKTGRDPRVLPKTVIYDPELTMSLPLGLSVTSAMNAIAHAVEGLYAHDTNPIMQILAEEGIRALGLAIPKLVANSQNVEARSNALYGAWLCGTVLGNVGMALHHKLCHTLGGSFNLPHAEVHTVILPHAMAFNSSAVPEAEGRVRRALGVSDQTSAAAALYDLARMNGAPVSLKDIGMKEPDLDTAAEIATTNPYWNPVTIGPNQRDAIRQLLNNAFNGVRPA
jgi:maleylacetate reductase